MKHLILAFLIIGFFALQAQTQSAAVPCDIRANLVDTDPNGVNVRQGAGKNFQVIGNLPTDRTDILTIVASQGAWVKINRAEDEEGRLIFNRDGWVFASLLGMTVSWNPADKLRKGHHNLYAEPSEKSRVLERLAPESAVTLAGCRGRWAKVRINQKSGWLSPEAQCTNTRTSCS